MRPIWKTEEIKGGIIYRRGKASKRGDALASGALRVLSHRR
jgi:hypothetical protein